eukprot:scaffold4180_cov99-Cylindrotheca_fusiformis.AAC.8
MTTKNGGMPSLLLSFRRKSDQHTTRNSLLTSPRLLTPRIYDTGHRDGSIYGFATAFADYE